MTSTPFRETALAKKEKSGISSHHLVIGIGASAGGLQALKDLFSTLPQKNDLTIIVAQHIEEAGKALAVESLRRLTKQKVEFLQDGMPLELRKIYLLPPHSLLSFENGTARLKPANTTAEKLAVVNQLFTSIGETFGETAVGVILSGKEADGAEGIRKLNDCGGLTIAQNPETAEHRSMPENAIATGAVDYILSPVEIVKELLLYHKYLNPPEATESRDALKEEIVSAITSICEIVHQKTNHDFKHYKTSTLLRRIQRRMQVLHLTTVQEYLDHLTEIPEECEILFNELLINVTNFFRDKSAFESLKTEVLSKLLSEERGDKKVRIWVAGCSTGEEAYSIAILIREILETLPRRPEVQIIATDIDDTALNVARRGIYPATIVEHVSAERLSKYFIKRAGKYHIAKELRELCLFSVHNLINDPPFSQLDLISCRNVMIYLGGHLQKKLFPVFHYALRANGYLFLGNSETLTSHKELFKAIDTKHRIAQRKPTAIKLPPVNTSIHNYLGHFEEKEKLSETDLSLIGQRIALDEMPLRYAIVNDEGHILSASAGLNKYVQIPEGTFQNHIVKLVSASLRSPLRSAFSKAKKEKRKITNDTCSLKLDDRIEKTAVIVQPMPQLGDISELYWIAFQNMGEVTPSSRLTKTSRADVETEIELVDQLERELTQVRQELDKSVQDLEASNEELKSSNEELLSMNEELQSANEELETSKEDVQNSNEALQRANSDLENLLASTQIATLFLDDDLQIRGFTPAIETIYNVRSTDIGRKISDFTTRAVVMPEFPALSVLKNSDAHESEVTLPDGKIFLRRILPYKNAEHARDGIVVTFIDISELRRSEGRFFTLANFVPVIAWTSNRSGDVDFFNSRWYEYTGQERETAEGWGWTPAVHPEDLPRTLDIWKRAIETGEQYDVEYRLRRFDGIYRWHAGTAVPLKDSSGAIAQWFGTCVDIHEQKEKVDLLEQSGRALRTIIEAVPQYIWRATPDGQADYASERFCKFVEQPLSKLLGFGWAELIHPDDRPKVLEEWQRSRKNLAPVTVDFRISLGEKPEYRWVRSEGVPYFDTTGEVEYYYGTWTDIHERTVLEEARRESERLFQVMADTAPVIVWISGIDGGRSWFNREWFDFTGSTIEQSQGEGWKAFVHPEDVKLYEETYGRHFAARSPFQLDYRLRYRDGSYRWISARGVPRFTENNEFEGFIGACLDINDQKRAEEAMRSSEAHFRTLVDNSPAMMWITDRNSYCTYLSKQWYEVTGGTPETDLGFGWIENCHDDDKAAASEAFFSAIKAKGRISIRYRLRHKDGQYRWAIDSGLPLHSADGEFVGYIGTVVDIHDQVTSQEMLGDLQERFERSTQATDLGVWYCDLPFDELIWNKEVKGHFFMAPDARVLITDFYAHIHPEDREKTERAIQYSIENHAPYDVIFRTIDPKDSTKLHFIRAIGWTDYDANDNPIRFDGITLNVTADYHRQEELKKAQAASEAANSAKTRFLANMSHEIRTPLAAILGYSDLLSAKISADKDANSYIERITRNSNQLGRLIDELLDLSKIEADKLEIDISTVDIDAIIEDVKSAMVLRAEDKGLELSFVWTTAKPTKVITDPVRLSQILINVVGNAVKFTERGSVRVELSSSSEQLCVRIADTGIGLTEEQQKKIFEPFMQADASVTRRYGGTGLGLALSKRLCRLLGGDLLLEASAPEKGTSFIATVAIQDQKLISEDSESKIPSATSQMSLEGKSILVVDDSPDNRMIVTLFLRSAGAKLDEAANGEEGVAKALAGRFDLVLMDIQMPILDGYQALERLKEMNFKTPVVALTAHAFKDERDRCIEVGFSGYITKPVTRTGLIASVNQLLQQ